MSFIGSARQWRPQRFGELIGQEHVRRTLTNALAGGRVASAYLFSGTRGVGKTTTARILAKALNCESAEGPVAEPCNACSSCEEITRGAHPDILEIDGATYTGVDHVRDLREGLGYRPARGRYKTVIIDEVHMLSKGAFNALLKTLEEPPSHVVFVFATTQPQRVPETILSRCQVFEFRLIPPGVIAAQLSRIVGEQGRRVDEGALRLLARMGEGSMRDAQSLLDQVLAFSAEDPLTIEDVESVLGVPSSQVYRNLVAAVVARDGGAALRELKGVFEAGHDLRLFCGNLLEFLRDLMVLQVAGEEEDLFEVGPGELEGRKALAGQFSFEEAHLAYAILQSAEAELRTSDHPRMTLELALLRMCQVEPIADLEWLIERLESLAPASSSRPGSAPPPKALHPAGGRGEGGSLSASESSPARPAGGGAPGEGSSVAEAARPPWDPEEARRIWTEAVQSLEPGQKFLLQDAEVDLGEEGRVRVRIPPGNGRARALDLLRETLSPLEDYFAARAPWPAEVVLDEAPAAAPAEGSAPAPEERGGQKEAEEAIIQEVVDLFHGQIVAIRPLRTRGTPSGPRRARTSASSVEPSSRRPLARDELGQGGHPGGGGTPSGGPPGDPGGHPQGER